jgi:Acylphosphatase
MQSHWLSNRDRSSVDNSYLVIGRRSPMPDEQSLMERRRIVFSGRVQGVGFRATARAVASRFEVTGWVRNADDGTVEMEVQAEIIGRGEGLGNASGDDRDACDGIGSSGREIERFLSALRGAMGRNIADEWAERVSPIPGELGFAIRR